MLFEDRSRAESFGAIAELYDRVRPSYPDALVDALLAGKPRRVLDIGCGTGIVAALLAARGCERAGRGDRRAHGRRSHARAASTSRWRRSSAGTRGDRTFDLLVAGQAWHWIDPVAGAQKAAAVLRGRRATRRCSGTSARRRSELAKLFAPIYARLAPGVESYSVLLGGSDARADTAVAGIVESAHFMPRRCARSLGPAPRHRAVAGDAADAQRPPGAAGRSSAGGCSRRSARRSTRSAGSSRCPTRRCSSARAGADGAPRDRDARADEAAPRSAHGDRRVSDQASPWR